MNDAIGIEMIELLELLCHRFKMPNLFIHHARLSDQVDSPHFCEKTFQERFEEYEKSLEDIRKVWVCGPPIMQEHFDRALGNISSKKIDYHIL